MTTERTRCPDANCGAFDGHHPRCGIASVEYKAAQLIQYYDDWLEQRRRFMERNSYWQNQVSLRDGKIAILRHENNQLRKKIVRGTTSPPPDKTPTQPTS